MKNTKQLFSSLLAATFMTAPAFAADSNIDVDYLNNLTGPKVTWSDSEGTALNIGDKTFYYTYHMPDGYEETNTQVTQLTEDNVTHKLFKDIEGYYSGGAISLWGNGDYSDIDVTSDFIGNYIPGEGGNSGNGGAIALDMADGGKALGNVTGTFIDNHVDYNGGAIYSSFKTTISGVSGNFIGNYSGWNGGAIAVSGGTIDDISGNFIGNYASGVGGGAINACFDASFSNISGNFIGNHVIITEVRELRGGGAIHFWDFSNSGNVSGYFMNNYAIASGEDTSVNGGAILSIAITLNLINSSFIDNYVEGSQAHGGAIFFAYGDSSYRNQSLNITADNGTSLFDGNKANGESSAIYMSMDSVDYAYTDLNLSALNGGIITFNDNINGGIYNWDDDTYSEADSYNLNVYGDGSGEVQFNAKVEHAVGFNLGENSVTHLGLDGEINAQTMSVVASNLIGRADDADTRPTITVDIEVDKANNTVKTGAINIAGDIEGNYRVIVNSLNDDVLEDAIVKFLNAEEDSPDTESDFEVTRVIGSPYLWNGIVNAEGEETGSNWYLSITDIPNPDYEPEVVVYAPEVIAALGLHEAAIEQTRSVTRNVRNKVASTRGYCDGCGVYPTAWDGKTLNNAWVLAQGETANIDKPVDMDAKIWGVEAGFDIQNDVNNTLGVFASYRDGEYDLSGKTSRYLRTTGSEIDINSWLGGLYYRYDKNMNWLFATVYGGIQKAKAKTDDGIAKFKTDGIELGASAEIGHTFALTNDLTLDPSLGVFYTQVDFDKAHDNVGKEYNWKNIKHAEAELGAKLTKQFDNAKVYVKPSVIQTLTGSDKVTITGLGKADTYHDQTLGRIELGGDYSFSDALTAYLWGNYTFGSSYDALAGGLGLNYAW